jgi:S-adenosylmethionine:tRNA ribosyltransferase-isomerase
VAVGTTVVRALETAASGGTASGGTASGGTASGGTVAAYDGWTSLVLGPSRPARVVTGLLTGLHEPEASHLDLLEAVAGRELVDRAYAEVTDAEAPRYLWHEFGDSMLLLP